MSKEQSIMVYEDTKTKTTRYEVNGVDITSSVELLKEQFLNQWNKEHKITTELTFYERNKISDLETKLAESEETARAVIEAHVRVMEERDKLKQQLAEKEKEIISLECVISEIHNDIKELHEFKVGEDEYDLTDSDARFSLQCDLLNNDQDKIEFAIERLEKVKDLIYDLDIGDNYKGMYSDIKVKRIEVYNVIDNQINELKDKKDV